jgi:GxxExxY protein
MQFIHQELSRDIISAAMKVLNTLRPGLDEKLYENALLIELTTRGHRVDQQKSFPVHYAGRFSGRLIPDLIVNEPVIVDAKVADAIAQEHIAQMLGYFEITEFELALLLNFKRNKLEFKRVIRKSQTGEEFLE